MRENEILVREQLSEVVVKFVIYKPLVAASVRAGSSGNALSVGWPIFAPPLERPGPAARRTF